MGTFAIGIQSALNRFDRLCDPELSVRCDPGNALRNSRDYCRITGNGVGPVSAGSWRGHQLNSSRDGLRRCHRGNCESLYLSETRNVPKRALGIPGARFLWSGATKNPAAGGREGCIGWSMRVTTRVVRGAFAGRVRRP